MSIAAIGPAVAPPELAFQTAGSTHGGTSFVVPADPVAGPQMVQGGGGISAGVLAAAMLSLQEVVPASQRAGQVREREARKRGRDLLAALAGLQREMLWMINPAAGLDRLAGLLDNSPEAGDPELVEILGAIRLRAEIETLKFARRQGTRISPSMTEP